MFRNPKIAKCDILSFAFLLRIVVDVFNMRASIPYDYVLHVVLFFLLFYSLYKLIKQGQEVSLQFQFVSFTSKSHISSVHL